MKSRHPKQIANRKYEKTINGYLMRMYRNMKARVLGQQLPLSDSCGTELIEKEDFYNFAKTDIAFQTLFETWTKAGYPKYLSPTANRIDPRFGFEKWNLQFVTFQEAGRRTAMFKLHNKII